MARGSSSRSANEMRKMSCTMFQLRGLVTDIVSFFFFFFSVIAVGFVGTRILWNCSFFLLGNSWFVS